MTAAKSVSPARARGKKRVTNNPVRLLASHAVDAVLEKKARDVTVMDMRGVSGVADYFVLCTGDSDLQIKAISDAVIDRIQNECNERPWHIEGYGPMQWVLVDYVDLVVHIFNAEKRSFYALERLWGDAPTEEVPEDASSSDVGLLQEESSRGRKSNGRT